MQPLLQAWVVKRVWMGWWARSLIPAFLSVGRDRPMKQSDGFGFETPEQGGTNQVKGRWWCGDYYGRTCHAIFARSRRCGYCRGGGLSCLLVGDGEVMASGSRHEESWPTMDGRRWGFAEGSWFQRSLASPEMLPTSKRRRWTPLRAGNSCLLWMSFCLRRQDKIASWRRDRTTPCFQFPWCCQLEIFGPTASAGEGCRIRRSHEANAPME